MKTSNHILAILLALLMSLPGLIAQDTEGQLLKPIDKVQAEGFGLATVTNGDMVVVSTRMTRRLVVFERDQNYWMHTASIKGINEKVDMNASKGFGQSIAIENGRILVGAPESPIGPEKNVGLVEVFTFFEGKWKVDAVLRAPIPIADSRFGHALASSGNTILVGAPSTNSKTGEAVIYTLENGKWIATPLASDARPGYEFGASVALLGDNMAIVGAPGKDLRRSTVGALYIYEKGENNQWNMIQSINGNAKIENLGTSLAVRGNTLVAGAYDEVVIFNWNENKWDLTEEIENPNAGETFSFASSINLSPDGKNLLISASNHVFIYRSVGDSWALLNSLTDDNPRYGSASAIGNDFFLINSPYAGENMMEGAVYLHLIPTDTDEILLR